jgi:hypothetical protein
MTGLGLKELLNRSCSALVVSGGRDQNVPPERSLRELLAGISHIRQ